MSLTSFSLAQNTVVYLDPKGQIKATLAGSRTVTINDFDSKQALAEAMLACAPLNFALNELELEYQIGDHDINYGPAAIPVDVGSASPSASLSSSPSSSSSPSHSASASPSAS